MPTVFHYVPGRVMFQSFILERLNKWIGFHRQFLQQNIVAEYMIIY